MLTQSELTISSARILSAVNDLEGKVWNPMIHWKKKHAVFVELTTSSGLSGTGECWSFDMTPHALIAYIQHEVLPNILGRKIREIIPLLDKLKTRATLTARHGILASAVSGVDIALWDIHAKQQEQPLWKVINPAGTGRVQLYASGGLYGAGKSNDDLRNEFKRYVDSGFTAVKMKVGGLTIDEDIARVECVRKAIGDETELIVDGVYSFSEKTAAQFYDKIKKYRMHAFQSPVAADEIAGMKKLRDDGVPVMGIEAEYRPELLQQFIEGGAVEILQIAPIACGGVTAIFELANRAKCSDIILSPEVSSTALATMVACHLSAAHDAVDMVEYHMVHQLFFDRLPFSEKDLDVGAVALSESPGLGIDLSNDQLREHVRVDV